MIKLKINNHYFDWKGQRYWFMTFNEAQHNLAKLLYDIGESINNTDILIIEVDRTIEIRE